MIRVIYLNNIFKPNDRVVKSFDEQLTIAELKNQLGVDQREEFHTFIDGVEIENKDYLIQTEASVAIFPVIAKGGSAKNIAGVVAGIALMAFTGGAGAGLLGVIGTTSGTLGLGMTMAFGGALLMGNQKTPSIDTPDMSSSAFDGGYNWSTDNISVQAGQPIPLTYGSIRTSGQLLGRRLVTKDIDGEQVQFLYLLLGANDGELDSITDIKVNDNAIENITNAYYETKLGTNEQTAVTGVLTDMTEQQVFNQTLPLEVAGSSWITKTQTAAGAKLELEFVHSSGVYGINTANGAIGAVNVYIRAQYREVGSSTWIDMFGDTSEPYKTIYKGLRKPYYWKYELTPSDPSKLYEFRAQNYSLEKYNSTNGWTEIPSNYSMSCNWLTLTVIDDVSETYPNTAIVALGLPASENLSGSLPKVSWIQTRNNVWVWNGSAYVQKDAQNLAWMVYNTIHDCRYLKNINTGSYEFTVFGEPKENLSYEYFSNWALFCETLVGGVATAKGNLLVDSASGLWTCIQKIATSARGFIIQQAGVFKPVWDAPTTMKQIFTSGNIITGSLKGSFLPEKQRANAIEASFMNEDNDGEKDTIFVTIDGYDPSGLENPTQVFFPGLTNPKIVYAAAMFLLKKNKYLKRTKNLQADIDSIVTQVGDVAGIQCDIASWGVGGRILGATTEQIVIDQDATLEAGGDYSILIRLQDNTLVRKTLDTVTANVTTNTLNFTSNPFSTAPEMYSVYAFGAVEQETKPFTIAGISRNGDLQATISAIEYIEDIHFPETDFPVVNYSASGSKINTLTVNANSDTQTLGISWSIPENKDYSGAWVIVDGKPTGFITTENLDYEVSGTPGNHTVKVIPVDGKGRIGTSQETTVTLAEASLNDVSDLVVTSTVTQQEDGTSFVYIKGSLTLPALAETVRVLIGKGAAPTDWITAQNSQATSFRFGPVEPGQLYKIKILALSKYASSSKVETSLTTVGDTTAPSVPTVAANATFKAVTVECTLAGAPSDMAGFLVYKSTTGLSADAEYVSSISSQDGEASFTYTETTYGTSFYYFIKAFDTWQNPSGFSGASSIVEIASVGSIDLVDGALNRSELFAEGVVAAREIAEGAVTSIKTDLASIDNSTGNLKANTVTALQIQTDAVIASKILALNITTAKLAAGSVTMEKLLIGKAGSALNDDPNFVDESAWSLRSGSGPDFVTITNGIVGDTAARAITSQLLITARRIPIDHQKSYRLRAWFMQENTTGTTNYITYRYVNANGTLQSQNWSTALTKTTTAWEALYLIIDPPSTAVAVILGVDINYYSDASTVYTQDLRIEEVLPATLIKDGSILTDKLAANAVTAIKIDTSAVTADKINAGAITTVKIDAEAVTADKVDATIVKTTELQVFGKNRCPDPAFRNVKMSDTSTSLKNVDVGSWECYGTADTYGYHKQDIGSTLANDFSNAIKMDGSDTTYSGIQTKKFGVTSNVVYMLSAYFAVSGWATRILTFEIAWYTDAGVYVSKSALYTNQNIATQNVFRKSTSVTAPSTASLALIRITVDSFTSGGVGQIYVSAIQLEEGSTATAFVMNKQGTITADAIVAGLLKSANYSATAGSLHDLGNGTFNLGGSSVPKLSWNGSLLDIDGKVTANEGAIGGITIIDEGMFNATGYLTNSKYSTIGLFNEALDSSINIFDMDDAGFRVLSYTFGPYINSSVTIGAGGTIDGATTAHAHIHILAESTSDYALYSNGIVRAIIQSTSDGDLKHNFYKNTVLAKLLKLDIPSWEYSEEAIENKAYEKKVEYYLLTQNKFPLPKINNKIKFEEDKAEQHIGPIAQDFNKLFGVEHKDNTAINVGDQIGVALRAIQELAEIVDKQTKQISNLTATLEAK